MEGQAVAIAVQQTIVDEGAERPVAGGMPVRFGWQKRRREEFEALGLLLGILGILLVVAMTIGPAAPP